MGALSGTVIGLFAGASEAEIALNNLAEADYDSSTISVVSADAARAQALSNAQGPLSRVAADRLPTRLEALGLSAQESATYGQRLASGAVFVAVEAPDGSENDAMEILTDQKAELVHCLPGRAAG